MKRVALEGKFKTQKRVRRSEEGTYIGLWIVRIVPVDEFYRIFEGRHLQEIGITKEIPGLCPQGVFSNAEDYVVLSLQSRRGKDITWVGGYAYYDVRLFVPDPKNPASWKRLPKEKAKDAFIEHLVKTYGIELEIHDSLVF